MNRIIPAAVLLVAIALAGVAEAAPKSSQTFAGQYFTSQALGGN